MNVKQENLCRLCLKEIENDFQVIDDVTKAMFNFLLLKVNLDISEYPLICHDCTQAVNASYVFKSNCIDKEKLVSANKQGFKIELKNVHEDCKGTKTAKDADFNGCRFCMEQSERSNFVLIDILMAEKFAEMMLAFMPEIDLSAVNNPLVCTSCRETLECCFKFIRSCWAIEEKIKTYCGIVEGNHIKLHDIQNFSGNAGSMLSHKSTQVKQDICPSEETENIFSEELHIKDEIGLDIIHDTSLTETKSSRSDVDRYKCMECTFETGKEQNLRVHMVTHKDIDSATCKYIATYKCKTCPFQTKYKGSLKYHMITHKDASGIEMYKCTSCTYETNLQRDMRSHLLTHKPSSEVETYKCASCTYETKYKITLIPHVRSHRRVSKEAGTYQCTLCDYTVYSQSDFMTHSVLHKEGDVYKCLKCTFKTVYKKSLKRHMLNHKDKSEVEMHRCVRCTFETKHKNYLKNHLLTHKVVRKIETCN